MTAKKLPKNTPAAGRAGAGRPGTIARTGVDLNKQANAQGGQNEPCNC
jgi:Ras-related protein Rab-5C